MDFRWNDWNIDHIARHGVDPEDAEWVIANAQQPYPEHRGDGKWLVWGPRRDGRLHQVVFVLDEDDTVYVIHARALTRREQTRFRRRRRK